MMGIFYTSMLALSVVGLASFTFGLPVIASFGAGVLSTGLFSGIMASRRASTDANAAHRFSRDASRAPARPPEQSIAPAVVPAQVATPSPVAEAALEQAADRQQEWVNQVKRERHPVDKRTDRPTRSADQVKQILADRSLTDGDRADAILKVREQAAQASKVAGL